MVGAVVSVHGGVVAARQSVVGVHSTREVPPSSSRRGGRLPVALACCRSGGESLPSFSASSTARTSQRRGNNSSWGGHASAVECSLRDGGGGLSAATDTGGCARGGTVRRRCRIGGGLSGVGVGAGVSCGINRETGGSGDGGYGVGFSFTNGPGFRKNETRGGGGGGGGRDEGGGGGGGEGRKVAASASSTTSSSSSFGSEDPVENNNNNSNSNNNAATASSSSKHGSYELPVLVIVECAMLAALTGLSFHLSTLFRMDAYFGALFPMPVVIAAARHSNGAARRVMITASLLLFIISGPLRSMNYLFLHGAMAYCLGILWNKRCSWWVTIPASAAVRSAGIFASLAVSSVVLRENVMALLVTQMYGLLDQVAANIGANFMLSIGWVWAIAVGLVLINSLSYVVILHAVYAIVLNVVVRPDFVNAPRRVKKMLGVTT